MAMDPALALRLALRAWRRVTCSAARGSGGCVASRRDRVDPASQWRALLARIASDAMPGAVSGRGLARPQIVEFAEVDDAVVWQRSAGAR